MAKHLEQALAFEVDSWNQKSYSDLVEMTFEDPLVYTRVAENHSYEVEVELRITSYNVCYTKLLRVQLIQRSLDFGTIGRVVTI